MTGTLTTAVCLGALLLGSAACGGDSSTPETIEAAGAVAAHAEAPEWRKEDLVDALGLTLEGDDYVFSRSDGITCAVHGVISSSIEVTLHEQHAGVVLTAPSGEVGVFWRTKPRTSPLQGPTPLPGIPGSCRRDLEQKLANLPGHGR